MTTLDEILTCEQLFHRKSDIMKRFSLLALDITLLKIDAIVNAANSTLLGGGGVDGAIHRAAGPELYKECMALKGCNTGEAKITKGYLLPAKHIIHTVGPSNQNPDLLRSAYANCLSICTKRNITSIAFPCISTGVYGFPREAAAEIAIETSIEYLKNHANMKRIIFCCFLIEDYEIYRRILQDLI